jgi:hypothetical protein
MTVRKLLLGTAAALMLASSPGHARTEKTMPIEFVGEWCFASQEDKTTEYKLPSWIEGGHCTKIISIDQYGFNDDDKNCEPVKVRLTRDTAPSGTAYIATVTARCYPNGQTITGTADGVLKTFEFNRYKGSLTVTTKGRDDDASCVDLRDDSHKVTVRGTLIQSTTVGESEGGGPPHKYMAIVLDHPVCGFPDEKSIAVGPVSAKWIGHRVSVTGTVEPTGEGTYIDVQHIDSK